MKSALVFFGALACLAVAGVPAAAQSCADVINPNTGVSDCPTRAALCNNPAYMALMTSQCPKTCGRCPTTTTANAQNCVDIINPNTGVSDCPTRAALCSNPTYYALMTQQCPKTCGRCVAEPPTTVAGSQ